MVIYPFQKYFAYTGTKEYEGTEYHVGLFGEGLVYRVVVGAQGKAFYIVVLYCIVPV